MRCPECKKDMEKKPDFWYCTNPYCMFTKLWRRKKEVNDGRRKNIFCGNKVQELQSQ